MATLPALLAEVRADLAAVPELATFFARPPERIEAGTTPALLVFPAVVVWSIGPHDGTGPTRIGNVTVRAGLYVARTNLAANVAAVEGMSESIAWALLYGLASDLFGGTASRRASAGGARVRMGWDENDWGDDLLRLNHDLDVVIEHAIGQESAA